MYPISACFGFPFMDLPSVTLNGLNTILNAGTVRKPSSLSKNKNQYFNPNLFSLVSYPMLEMGQLLFLTSVAGEQSHLCC